MANDGAAGKPYLGGPRTILALALALPVVAIIGLMVGNIGPISAEPEIGVWEFLRVLFGMEGRRPQYEVIIWEIRMPRVLMGLLCGAGLAVSGTAMQGMFRNPMADPYIIGLSSGAGLGAALAILAGVSVATGQFSLPVMAFLGALGTLYVVYLISVRSGRLDVNTMLLAGVAVGAFLSALTAFLMYMSSGQIRRLFFWMMGTLLHSTWTSVAITLPVVAMGTAALMIFSRHLDAVLFGEETAHNLGVDVERLKTVLFSMTALLAGVTVAFCGIIGFVGLVVPHIFRLLVGPRHTYLYPVSALGGACFLVLADSAGQLILSPAEMPVGIITAICGAPFFVYLLMKRGVGGDGT